MSHVRKHETLARIFNAEREEQKRSELREQLFQIKKVIIIEKIIKLDAENKDLATMIEDAKLELLRLETLHGRQYSVPPFAAQMPTSKTNPAPKKPKDTAKIPAEKYEIVIEINPAPKKRKETAKIPAENSEIVNEIDPPPKKPKDTAKIPAENSGIVNEFVKDVRKLDLRIGKIIEVTKHPNAEYLYIEKIDCGEESPRTVVSGLENYMPLDGMQDKVVMVLCNMRPVKMRGVTSEALVICASTPEKVEVLEPPPGAVPGDLVECEGYPREPDAILNPNCAPDLMTNNDRVACYNGKPLLVPGKGPIVAPTLKSVNVN